jgi:hypothetical protein
VEPARGANAVGPRREIPWRPIALSAAAAFVLLFTLAVAFGFEPGPAKPTPDVASPVDGVVIAVDATGLNQVRGFTLRPTTGGPFSFSFVMGPLENATEFSPAHLSEHLATSEPIRVWFRAENGERVVYRLEDAPG